MHILTTAINTTKTKGNNHKIFPQKSSPLNWSWSSDFLSIQWTSDPVSNSYLPPSQNSWNALRRRVCSVLFFMWCTYPEYQLDFPESLVGCSFTQISIVHHLMNFQLSYSFCGVTHVRALHHRERTKPSKTTTMVVKFN